ncbi:MAG: MotA/TolQ/ExbB proton channel family protein [Limisphaerales bacterium]|jgi:biopolymer transport protein ExbB|nr:MotA/TolQ/ExbB proton channel family protein [Verrucomicrobiota bacterium]
MFEFLQAGGPFMWLLLIMSIVSVTFIIERSLALRWNLVIPKTILEELNQCRDQEGIQRLHAACQAHDSPAGRLLTEAMQRFAYSKAENIEMLQTKARKEVAGLESGLVIIEVIVGSAPLLGLVGTLHGLITLFGDFGAASMADHTVLAKGISIALNTTLTGLLVAIPSLIAWSYLNKKVETMTIELESLCGDFLHRFYPAQGGGLDPQETGQAEASKKPRRRSEKSSPN